MDIRNPIWHGQLQISGIRLPTNHSGSIMSLFANFLQDLNTTNPRILADGNREIIIRIRDRQFGPEKESTEEITRVLEVSANLDESQTTRPPNEGERFETYVAYLQDCGMGESAAVMIASDWYKCDPPANLLEWLHDPKAARFRLLNSSREAYDSASPNEYLGLKREMEQRFPEFMVNLTCRIA